jgi:hypothetical protein
MSTERDSNEVAGGGSGLNDGLCAVGTRIVFIKTLTSPPDEDGPGNLYARKGELGIVTGHGCREGHWVKWDKWEAPFGAVLGKDFEVHNAKLTGRGPKKSKLMNDIFIVGQPVPKVWLHMEFDFEDTQQYLNNQIIESQDEADRLYEKYTKPNQAN